MIDVDKVREKLRESDLYFEDVVPDGDDGVLVVIEWGDWKHEHLYCDHLMSEMGFALEDAEVTEEDGSDTYSADRYYKKRAS